MWEQHFQSVRRESRSSGNLDENQHSVMSKSKKSRSRRAKRKIFGKIDDFSKGVGLSPLRIVFSALLLGGLAFLIYWVGFRTGDSVEAPKAISKTDALKLELGTDQRLEAIMNAPSPNTNNFLVVMNQMNEYEDELSKIESENELTEGQQQKLERIRLRNQSVIVMLMLRNNISCVAERKELFRRCEAQLNSSDQLLREASYFWLCMIPTVEFCDKPSDETFQNFTTAIDEYKDGYINTPEKANKLAEFIDSLAQQSTTSLEYAKRGYRALGAQMAASSNGDVQQISNRLYELALYGQFKLNTLEYRIAWSDPTGSPDFAGAIETLSQNTDSDLAVWVTMIRAYESFLALDKIEEVGGAWQQIWELSSQITDKDKMKMIRDVLTRQKQRAMSIGKPFDLTGKKLPNGDDISQDGHDYNVVIFCDKSEESLRSLVKLGSNNNEKQVAYRPILVFADKLNDKDVESLKIVPKNIVVTTHETAVKYMKSFQADFFPYVLLIDGKGNIIAANLQIDQVENRIAKLEAAKRQSITPFQGN